MKLITIDYLMFFIWHNYFWIDLFPHVRECAPSKRQGNILVGGRGTSGAERPMFLSPYTLWRPVFSTAGRNLIEFIITYWDSFFRGQEFEKTGWIFHRLNPTIERDIMIAILQCHAIKSVKKIIRNPIVC